MPPAGAALATFRRLAERVSPERVRWRYDPIVLSTLTPEDYHLERFAYLAAALEGYTRHCTFSFTTFYAKTERNLAHVARATGAQFRRPEPGEQRALAQELAGLAAAHGMRLNACCGEDALVPGVARNRCVDPELIAALVPDGPPLKPLPTRPGCGCVASVDIGAYNTCLFGCAYCYATSTRRSALERHAQHRAEDTLLWRGERGAGSRERHE